MIPEHRESFDGPGRKRLPMSVRPSGRLRQMRGQYMLHTGFRGTEVTSVMYVSDMYVFSFNFLNFSLEYHSNIINSIKFCGGRTVVRPLLMALFVSRRKGSGTRTCKLTWNVLFKS